MKGRRRYRRRTGGSFLRIARILFCASVAGARTHIVRSCARREKAGDDRSPASPRGRPAFGACQSVRRVRAKAARDGRDGEASEGDRRLQQDDEVRHRDGRAHLQAPPVGEVRPREEEVHGCVRGAPWDPQTPLAIARSNAPPPSPVVSAPPTRAPLLCASPRALTCDPPRTQRTTSTTRAASGTESRWCTVAP